MSFFYLSPVKGDMPLHLLEIIVTKRLEFLKDIFSESIPLYNEYVIEGSVFDNVGHFMLCVLVILSENVNVSQFFLRSEQALFKKRLDSLSAYDMRAFAKKVLRTVKKHEKPPPFIDPLEILCQHLLLKNIAKHICTLHNSDCVAYHIRLHFKHCLTFVAKREVELQNGYVHFPCGKWKQYLIELYITNLKHRIKNTNLEKLKSDPRVMELLMKIKGDLPIVPTLPVMNPTQLLSKDVDETSNYFPPCMLNLHQHLRKRHRLSHSQRFYYSLFLKDIGMSVEEAVTFWRSEYRQNPSSHSCCHNWERDEKKYLYGIRHMYGLEGARKNYTSVSCRTIQNSDTSCSEGGCPFKSFDSQNMSQILNANNTLTQQTLTQINGLKNQHQYTSACILYLKSCTGNTGNNCDISFNFTPVKYFMISSKKECDVQK